MFGILCGISSAQTPVISLETTQSTTISPNSQITIEAFIDQVLSPSDVRGYQISIEFVPRAGTTGTLVLADPSLPPDPNTSIFVDTSRSDWVFAGARFISSAKIKL